MSKGCSQENCTVGDTGSCMLGNDSKTCPHRVTDAMDVSDQIAPPLPEPARNPQFPRSLTLTASQVRDIMASRYCRLIGILGAPDAGKTAALVSLYLLVARGKLSGHRFADSRSLLAFDEISAGARRWNDEGKMPEQLTAHTQLTDDRSAGFLHLRLKPFEGESVDFLLPDLPGEWTTAMIDSGRVDRLQFLKSADVIWLMVDGRQLAMANTRHLSMHRTKLMMHRLAENVSSPSPVILVVTRRDEGSIAQAVFDELSAEAVLRGLNMTIIQVASFAAVGSGIEPGVGIRELIDASAGVPMPPVVLWPNVAAGGEERAMMRFRAEGDA